MIYKKNIILNFLLLLSTVSASENIVTTNFGGIKLEEGSTTHIVSVGFRSGDSQGVGADQVVLGNIHGSVKLVSSNIVAPTNGVLLLAINANGEIVTSNPTILGSLTDNYVQCLASGDGDITLKTVSGKSIILDAAGSIKLSNSLTSGVNTQLLAIRSDGVLIGTHGLEVYNFGEAPGNRIVVDQMVSSGNGILLSCDGKANNNIELVTSDTGEIILNSNALKLQGQLDLPTGGGNTLVLTIDSNGHVGTAVSSARYKNAIKGLDIDQDYFDLLRPVSYQYNKDDGQGKHYVEYGFIAEEVHNIPQLKEAVIYDKQGKPLSINYNSIFVALVQSFKEAKKNFKHEMNKMQNELNGFADEIVFLKKENKDLKKKINEQEIIVNILKKEIDRISHFCFKKNDKKK